jgi:hypothetical protein
MNLNGSVFRFFSINFRYMSRLALAISTLRSELTKMVPIADKALSKDALLAVVPPTLGPLLVKTPKENSVGEMLKMANDGCGGQNLLIREEQG